MIRGSIINENGLKFNVDLENGQKTGYFLDQQDNRRAIQEIVKDAEVLGAFTYTGTFEIHAAHYGAKVSFRDRYFGERDRAG